MSILRHVEDYKSYSALNYSESTAQISVSGGTAVFAIPSGNRKAILRGPVATLSDENEAMQVSITPPVGVRSCIESLGRNRTSRLNGIAGTMTQPRPVTENVCSTLEKNFISVADPTNRGSATV